MAKYSLLAALITITFVGLLTLWLFPRFSEPPLSAPDVAARDDSNGDVPFVVKTFDGLARKNLSEKGLACNSVRPFQPSPKATAGRGEAGQAVSLTCCNAAMSNGRSV